MVGVEQPGQGRGSAGAAGVAAGPRLLPAASPASVQVL